MISIMYFLRLFYLHFLSFTVSLSIDQSLELERRQSYALFDNGLDSSVTVMGNYYNHWTKYENGTMDLTRKHRVPVTSPKIIPMFGWRSEIIIEPSRSALVVIDMQNFFLHPKLSPRSITGRNAVQPTVDMIKGFRKHGMKILWSQWGLTDYDVLTMPPSFKFGFTTNWSDRVDQSFGCDMGTIEDDGNKMTEVGPKLMRGSWNAEPYGILGTMKDEGLKAGTDLLFNKARLSGLWGSQSSLGTWLKANEITTLFFGGVNADQCVWSTFSDAYFEGYDVVYVDDITATTSPEYASQMVRHNGNGYGFLGNSTAILKALG